MALAMFSLILNAKFYRLRNVMLTFGKLITRSSENNLTIMIIHLKSN